MNALVSYQFEEEPVRVVMIDGEPWFVANDVAKALGYPRQQEMVRLLDDDEKGVHNVHSPGGEQETSIISESGMYHAALKRRGAHAKRFRRWVTEEVLPAIRKTGKYVLHTPPTPVMLTMDTARVSASVGLLRETRRLFGLAAARQMWIELGLPAVIAEATSDQDTLIARLRTWLEGRSMIVAQDATRAMFGTATSGAHDRVLEMLRLLGWTHRATMVDGQKRTFWFPPPALAIVAGTDREAGQ
jgi:prophage antirepressor-like protein